MSERAETEHALRAALWRCYQATGADTSSDDVSRNEWLTYAPDEVERMRREYDGLTDIVLDVIYRKHPDETPHEFAKRRLREVETEVGQP